MPAKDYNSDFIERIVQEVIRRLLDRKVDTAGAAPTAARELVLAERVVTLETLRGRLDDVRSVAVAAHAIVTPAVKDELNDRGIKLKKR